MNLNEFIDSIQQYQKIAIFRHVHPDCDAFGSQFGLKQWFKDNFKDKDVRALGTERTNQGIWPELDEANDDWYQDALAIVLDTANQERIDGTYYLKCKKVIKIDHHPNKEPYGDLILVDESAAATCEILTSIFKEIKGTTLSKQTANYLYKGLLTDTLCYKTSNTTANTLAAGAYLASTGIDIPEINRELFDLSLMEFEFRGYIQSNFKLMNEHIAYLILDQQTLKKWNLTASEARNYVSSLGNVKEFEAWCLFTQQENQTEEIYDGSLRSKRVTINDIAEKYHGGGHKNACGVKDLTLESVSSILSDIDTRIKEEN